jgi:hypothetical protein
VIDAAFRPLPVWPHDTTPADRRRSRWTFKAAWSDTLQLLHRELRQLGARDIVVGCGLRPEDIRQDGWPRASAREPVHPGVEISFDTAQGRLVYATDVCQGWEHNVRAIALGLQALRAVDRHGITRRGEQYAGFKTLPPATLVDGDPRHGEQLVHRHGSVRAALHATHPDHGGDPDDLRDVIAYRAAQAA